MDLVWVEVGIDFGSKKYFKITLDEYWPTNTTTKRNSIQLQLLLTFFRGAVPTRRHQVLWIDRLFQLVDQCPMGSVAKFDHSTNG